MTEFSSIKDNLEEVTDSDLKIKSLMHEPDSVIEEIMTRMPCIRDSNKIGTEHLSKVWCIDYENTEISLGVVSQIRARMDNPSLARSYSVNDRVPRNKVLD